MGFQDWFRRRFARSAPTPDTELLAKLASALEETRIPYLRIDVADTDAPLAPTESKIGGVPYAPVGAELPSGEPFSFVAQINFADVELEPFPHRGLVQTAPSTVQSGQMLPSSGGRAAEIFVIQIAGLLSLR
jgi:uncharacterized protein DUF1963